MFQGVVLFHQNGCRYCHAIEGQGDGPGFDLSTAGTDLTNGEMWMVILNGAPGMPTYEDLLTRQEVELIPAFLSSQERSRVRCPGFGRTISGTGV